MQQIYRLIYVDSDVNKHLFKDFNVYFCEECDGEYNK